MKKLLLVLPTVLLLAAPVAIQAKEDHDSDHNPNFHASTRAKEQVKLNEEKEDIREASHLEDEDDDIGKGLATASAQLKQNNVKFHLNFTTHAKSATSTATPSAHLNLSVNGPLDQVVKLLEELLNFLKGLV